MRAYILLIPIIFCLLVFSCTKKTSTVAPQQKSQDSTTPPVTPQPQKHLVDTLVGTYKGVSYLHKWGGTQGGHGYNTLDTSTVYELVIIKIDSVNFYVINRIPNSGSKPDTLTAKTVNGGIEITHNPYFPEKAGLTRTQDSVFYHLTKYHRSDFSEYKFAGKKQ